jgi:hypothetical protein
MQGAVEIFLKCQSGSSETIRASSKQERVSTSLYQAVSISAAITIGELDVGFPFDIGSRNQAISSWQFLALAARSVASMTERQ